MKWLLCSAYYFTSIKIVQQLPGKIVKGLNYLQICPSKLSKPYSIQCSDILLPICNYPTCNLLLHFVPERKKKATQIMSSNWNTSWKLPSWRQESPIPSPLQQQRGRRQFQGAALKTNISSNKQEPASWPQIFAPNQQSPGTGYVTYQQSEASNSSSGLYWPKAARHHQPWAGQETPQGWDSNRTKDFLPGLIAGNSASAYQFLLADTTTCKISSLWWPSKVWAGLLDQQPEGCPAANGTLFTQAALTICQPLKIRLHQPSTHIETHLLQGVWGEGDKSRVSEICH